ncbi:hypothetical protein DFO66_103396 [Brevibacterium sanguinis]|uniref:Uncharacterized protein n=2 Tax=Brevibacterium TaxID=1696 RepID=A0A366ILL4_9MICO|nr:MULTISPECIES: hypothetical protein [Brevibacterium]RBP66446.1 hypothetical protein DFO66_103396 [Brevibacterium sanguinis]RBP73098.1 hypothetical protein DFO65_103396 [Brevibacterium celere]
MSAAERELKRLAKELANLKREVVSRRGPQLDYTSVEDGGNVTFKNPDGSVAAIVGGQDDGSNTINVISGPTPATPTTPEVSMDHGALIVRWDGGFVDALVANADWSRTEIHASTDPAFIPSRATARGSVVAASGGEVTIGVEKGPWTVCLVAWSQAGKMSAPSDPVTVEVPGYGDIVLAEIDAAQTRIDNARAMLVEGQETLGEKLDAADAELSSLRTTLTELDSTTLPALRQDLDAAEGRLVTAEGKITAAEQELDGIPGQISTARQQAIDAAMSEIDTVEASLITSIDKKLTWSLSDPPVVFTGPLDATWVKVSSFGSGGRKIGEWRWNGNVWVKHTTDGSVLVNVDAASINTGFLDVANRIRAGAIAADKVLVGAGRNIIPWAQVLSGAGVAPHSNDSSFGAGTLTIGAPDSTRGVPNHLLHNRTTADPGVERFILRLAPAPFTGGVSDRFAVSGGTWTFRVRGYTDVANLDAKLALVWYKADTTYGGEVRTPAIRLTAQPQTLSISITLPDDAAYIIPRMRTNQPGETHWVGAELALAVGGTFIEPEGIQTPHLAADVMNVSNLKAGVAAIAEAVVQKIAASTASIQQADIKNLFVTGTSSLSTVVAEQIAADTAQFIELEVGNLVAGTGTMDQATIQKLFTDVVVASMAMAEQFIGSNAILDESVTAPKIVASEELWAKLGQFVLVRAEQIAADAIDGKVITAPTIQTGRTGARIVLDPGGFKSHRSDDSLRAFFPTDSDQAFVDADFTARSLTAIGDVSLRSATTVESGGGSLTIGSGVTDPASPASISPWYEQVHPPALGQDETPYGLAWADGKFWRYVDVSGTDAGDRVEGIDPATGNVTATIPMTNRYWASFGLTAIGTRLYLLGQKSEGDSNWSTGLRYKAFVRIYETTGAYVGEWEYTQIGWSDTNRLVYRPGIGTDGTNIIIAQCDDLGALRWRKFNPTTGALISEHSNSSDRTKSDIAGIYLGAADWGTTYAVVGKKSNQKLEVFNPDGTWAGADLTVSALGSIQGLCWDGARFWTIDDSGVITRYESAQHGNKTNPWWLSYTYTDGSGHETRVGPVAEFQWPRRSGLMVSIPDAPQGATGARIYWGQSATEPTPSALHQVEVALNTKYRLAPSAAAFAMTTPAPPAENTFPAATPAEVKSTFGGFVVRGDGSGTWGPLTFNPDGTMTSSAVPAWVPITSFASGFTAAAFGFAPAYRVWPDGKVEWRGAITGNITGFSADLFTLPAATIPAQACQDRVTTNAVNGIDAVTRCEFRPEAAPTQFRVYRGSGDRTWVSLDRCGYYKL